MQQVRKVEQFLPLIYPAVISLGIGFFVSCAEMPPPSPQRVAIEPSPPPPPPLAHKERAFPLPARKPSPPPENAATVPQSDGEAVALAAPETPPSAPEVSRPTVDRGELVGLDQPAARRLLGPATEQSEAAPATIWRYRTPTCELDLFFYLDLRSGKMRTLHYAFKGDRGGEDCLRSLVAARGN